MCLAHGKACMHTGGSFTDLMVWEHVGHRYPTGGDPPVGGGIRPMPPNEVSSSPCCPSPADDVHTATGSLW